MLNGIISPDVNLQKMKVKDIREQLGIGSSTILDLRMFLRLVGENK